jgi:hypothetical protein
MKEQLDRIEAKLDKVIKALQDHDGLDEDFNEPYDEYAWENINSAAAEKENKFLNEERETLKPIPPRPKKKPYYKNKTKKNGNS